MTAQEAGKLFNVNIPPYIFWMVLVTVLGGYSGYTIRGEVVKTNQQEITTINEKLEYEYIKDKDLQLELTPLKQDISYIKKAVERQEIRQRRQEEVNWKILKQLENIGASAGTAHSGKVGGRALMRSTRDAEN